jgi:hypothetical protein
MVVFRYSYHTTTTTLALPAAVLGQKHATATGFVLVIYDETEQAMWLEGFQSSDERTPIAKTPPPTYMPI